MITHEIHICSTAQTICFRVIWAADVDDVPMPHRVEVLHDLSSGSIIVDRYASHILMGDRTGNRDNFTVEVPHVGDSLGRITGKRNDPVHSTAQQLFCKIILTFGTSQRDAQQNVDVMLGEQRNDALNNIGIERCSNILNDDQYLISSAVPQFTP